MERLAEEARRLHPLPQGSPPLGVTRRVNWDATISVGGALLGAAPPGDARCGPVHGEELIVTAVDSHGIAGEVARHQRGTPGTPVLEAAHYPVRQDKTGDRLPRARTAAEAAFLALGPGAAAWLVEAAAAGTRRIGAKMAEAVDLAKLHSPAHVDRPWAPRLTACFAEADLLSILDYQAGGQRVEPTRRGETHSLQPGTSAWASFGLSTPTPARPEESEATR